MNHPHFCVHSILQGLGFVILNVVVNVYIINDRGRRTRMDDNRLESLRKCQLPKSRKWPKIDDIGEVLWTMVFFMVIFNCVVILVINFKFKEYKALLAYFMTYNKMNNRQLPDKLLGVLSPPC